MSVERWATRDAMRQARRLLNRHYSGQGITEAERAYLHGMAAWLLLCGQLDEEGSARMREMVALLDLEVAEHG